ncbi:uncharacterized protein FA14DRAFT_17968 [Meira miltonrushii]|uniref:Uncharacterized protein n=1 Tax=Meira miltonrushii TaxID=1280837 RepID=A0A316VKC4_9BASI|nr:uncharacterized protein FA14DRAFT_17968 [Meira miltonrushii]PWN37694.1 hypothetical protein FA14DRAFT_17968 [Meira miltonrushii]
MLQREWRYDLALNYDIVTCTCNRHTQEGRLLERCARKICLLLISAGVESIFERHDPTNRVTAYRDDISRAVAHLNAWTASTLSLFVVLITMALHFNS